MAKRGPTSLSSVSAADVPPIAFRHFLDALASTRPSVGDKDLGKLMAWNEAFGSYPRCHQLDDDGQGDHQQQQEEEAGDKENRPAAAAAEAEGCKQGGGV